MHLAAAAAAAPVTDVAVITTISPNVRNIVRTVIATINLEAEVNREGTEAVADAEEEQETQDEKEEDSTECIHKQEEEEQEERHREEGSATTTGTRKPGKQLHYMHPENLTGL
jgi:cobalamin biosynthesis protein CobT